MMRGNKFHAVRTVAFGMAFGSKAEAKRAGELKILERAGEIRDLKFHTVHPLTVNGEVVGKYTDDASYIEGSGVLVIEDTKSKATLTEAAALRIRLFEAIYKIKVRLVGKGVRSRATQRKRKVAA